MTQTRTGQALLPRTSSNRRDLYSPLSCGGQLDQETMHELCFLEATTERTANVYPASQTVELQQESTTLNSSKHKLRCHQLRASPQALAVFSAN